MLLFSFDFTSTVLCINCVSSTVQKALRKLFYVFVNLVKVLNMCMYRRMCVCVPLHF